MASETAQIWKVQTKSIQQYDSTWRSNSILSEFNPLGILFLSITRYEYNQRFGPRLRTEGTRIAFPARDFKEKWEYETHCLGVWRKMKKRSVWLLGTQKLGQNVMLLSGEPNRGEEGLNWSAIADSDLLEEACEIRRIVWKAFRLRNPDDVVPGEGAASGRYWKSGGFWFYRSVSCRRRWKRCRKGLGKRVRNFRDEERRSEWVWDFVRGVKIAASPGHWRYTEGREGSATTARASTSEPY